jgi:hypothetical protein
MLNPFFNERNEENEGNEKMNEIFFSIIFITFIDFIIFIFNRIISSRIGISFLLSVVPVFSVQLRADRES